MYVTYVPRNQVASFHQQIVENNISGKDTGQWSAFLPKTLLPTNALHTLC